jgi:hypothetical protein
MFSQNQSAGNTRDVRGQLTKSSTLFMLPDLLLLPFKGLAGDQNEDEGEGQYDSQVGKE